MVILQTSDLASVRRRIDFRLRAKHLDDDIVQDFVEEAELDVIKRVPHYAELKDNDAQSLKYAVVYRAAYKLFHAVPQLVRSGAIDFLEQHEQIDRNGKLKELRITYNQHISALGVREIKTEVFDLEDGFKDAIDKEQLYSGHYQEFPEHYRGERYRELFGRANEDD